jgi:hypothetical protein
MTFVAAKLREIAAGRLEALPAQRLRHCDPRAEERDERVLRLLGEFIGDPDLIRLERLLEAYVAWKRSGLDRRGIALQPGLAALNRFGRRKIAEREHRERLYGGGR